MSNTTAPTVGSAASCSAGLLPCPFCGSKAYHDDATPKLANEVWCGRCGASLSSTFDRRETALERWQSRSPAIEDQTLTNRNMNTKTLKAGTIVKIQGIPVALTQDVTAESDHWDLIEQLQNDPPTSDAPFEQNDEMTSPYIKGNDDE